MDIGSREIHSNETALLIDSEIRNLITEAHQKAIAILHQHHELMDSLAKLLLEKETLGTEDIFELILRQVSEDDREMVQNKYDRAREMKFEHSDALDKEKVARENLEQEKAPEQTEELS